MYLKRILAILLVSVVLMGTLASCGDSSDQPAVSSQEPDQNTQDFVYDENGYVMDRLPALDYNNDIFHFLIGDYSSAVWEDFHSEGDNGSVIETSIYNVTQSVQDRLNLDLEMIRYTFDYTNRESFYTMMRNANMGGDSPYDLVTSNLMMEIATEANIFTDLASLKHADLSMPWYNQGMNGVWPGSRVYIVSGDGCLLHIKTANCIFVNEDLLKTVYPNEEISITQMVKDGEWVLDKLLELCTDVYADLDTDETASVLDRYGLTFGDNNKYSSMVYAFGMNTVERLENGDYELHLTSEHNTNVYDKIADMLENNENVRPGAWNVQGSVNKGEVISAGGGVYVSRPFVAGNALFTWSLLSDVTTITDYRENGRDGLGLAPVPMWDYEQSWYRTSVQRYGLFSIPAQVADAEMSAAFLEAWCSKYYRTVADAYYEQKLKLQNSKDQEMSEMYDLIRESIYMDFGTVFGIGTIDLRNMLLNRLDFTSTMTSQTVAAREKMTAIVDALRDREEA